MEKAIRDEITTFVSGQTKAIEDRLKRSLLEREDKFERLCEKLELQQAAFFDEQKTRINASLKDIEKKLGEQKQKAVASASKEIKDMIGSMGSITGLAENISYMQKLTDELLEKHIMLTEVAFMASSRNDTDVRVYRNLIRSMDFPMSWFVRRRNWTLDTLYTLYKNGVHPDPEDNKDA